MKTLLLILLPLSIFAQDIKIHLKSGEEKSSQVMAVSETQILGRGDNFFFKDIERVGFTVQEPKQDNLRQKLTDNNIDFYFDEAIEYIESIQESKVVYKGANYVWHQMTTVESVIPGGIGRSRMINLDTEGKMEEIKLENILRSGLSGQNWINVLRRIFRQFKMQFHHVLLQL